MSEMEQFISHHLLLCATPTKQKCCPDHLIGTACWETLKRGVKELGLEDPLRADGIVLRSKTDCLRICSNGPIMLIWPDGIVYEKLTPARIDAILQRHIVSGTPIDDWINRKYSLRCGTGAI